MVHDKVEIKFNFSNLTPVLITDLKDLVKYNIDHKVDSYLQKIFKKADAKVSIDINIKKNKKWEFNGIFNFMLDGKPFHYEREGYTMPEDLVNNAFDRLKEQFLKIFKD